MSLDTTGIIGYIKENPKQIATDAILGLESLKVLTIQPGVRSAMGINKLVTAATLQAGGCGWSPLDTTTLTKRDLSVTTYKVQEALCDEDLMPTLYQLIGKGTNDENFSIETAYVDLKGKVIGNALDSLIWNSVSVASGGSDEFDGLLQIITDDAPGGNQISRTGSVVDDMDSLIALLPSAALASNDLVAYMSRPNFLALMNELREKNYYHVESGDLNSMEMTYPYSNIKVVGVSGFGSVNSVVIANQSNLFVGTDLESELTDSKFWFSADNMEHRFHFGARIGVQVAIPGEIVIAA